MNFFHKATIQTVIETSHIVSYDENFLDAIIYLMQSCLAYPRLCILNDLDLIFDLNKTIVDRTRRQSPLSEYIG